MSIRAFAVGFLVASALYNGHATGQSLNRPEDVRSITDLETHVGGLTQVDQVIGYFATDATVADLSAPGWYEGRDQIYAALKPQFESLQTLKFEMKDVNVVTDGTFACAALQAHITGTLKGGSPLSLTFRQLDAFKKIDGSWRWVQQQVSYPTDPKSGRSVTDGPLPTRGELPPLHSASGVPASSSTAAKKEIRGWLDTAVRVTDTAAMTRLFGPGDNVILYNEFLPGELRGLREMRDYYGPLFSTIRDVQTNIPAFAAESDGNLGALISRQDLQVHMKDGTTQSLSIRQSDCLRRVNGKWRSFFEMVSFPMDLKTGKAVTRSPESGGQ